MLCSAHTYIDNLQLRQLNGTGGQLHLVQLPSKYNYQKYNEACTYVTGTSTIKQKVYSYKAYTEGFPMK